MTTAKTKDERPLRADAERNRQRILEAAAELFAQRGLQVSLDEVAARAGVGVGTVYRRFSDRDALIDALLRASFEEFLAILDEAAANPDPWDGLVHFIEAGAEFHGRNRAMKELAFSAPGGREWVDRLRAAIRPRVIALVEAAKQQGKLRPDLDLLDVPMVELMLASVIEFTGGGDSDAWRRMLGIVIDGMRAGRSAPRQLTAPALRQEELEEAMKRSGAFRPPRGSGPG